MCSGLFETVWKCQNHSLTQALKGCEWKLAIFSVWKGVCKPSCIKHRAESAGIDNQRLIKQRSFIRGRRFKLLIPAEQRFPLNGWTLQASALNSFEQDIGRCREIVQLHGGA